MEKEGKVLVSHLYQYNRYYEIMNLIEQESARLGKKEESLFRRELTGVYEFNRKLIDPTFNVALNKGAIDEAINRYWLEDVWSNRIWKNTNQLAERVRENLIDAFTTGSGTEQFTKNLMREFGVSYNNAKRLAVTEMAHTSTMSTVDGYVQMGVTKYKVLTEKDCCEVCEELNGKVFDINDDTGYVPLHPNCRCSIVAVE